MRVFCTGTSGTGRHETVERLIDYAAGQGRQVTVHDVGETMLNISRELGIPVPDSKMLDTGVTGSLTRAAAYERVLGAVAEAERAGKDVNILIGHACFRWRKALTPALHVSYLRKLSPDLYVVIIDDARRVEQRLQVDPKWRGRLTLQEVSYWRDEEQLLTEVFAEYGGKPFYVLPAKEPPETLFNLIFRPNVRKLYLSFPITHIRRAKPEKLDEVEGLERELRKAFVVFDPLSITDLIDLEGLEAHEVEALRDQTVARDYLLIGQSDFVVVYYPVVERSAGVLAEMRYAQSVGKKVYALIEEESPFIKEYCDQTFGTVEDLLGGLEQSEGGARV